MENIYPGIQAQVTIPVTLWGAALVSLQVEKSPRKGKKPRSACGPEESVPTEAEFQGMYGAAQLATVPFDPHLQLLLILADFFTEKHFLEFGTNQRNYCISKHGIF